jgi:hypothetical protein
MTFDQQETFDERAAIMQFCGGLSREDAERQARRIALNEGDEQMGFEAFKAFSQSLRGSK